MGRWARGAAVRAGGQRSTLRRELERTTVARQGGGGRAAGLGLQLRGTACQAQRPLCSGPTFCPRFSPELALG